MSISEPGPGLTALRRPPVNQILAIEKLDGDVFRGRSHIRARRIYGGQTLGQALVAAGRTVTDDRRPHSLHGQFVHPGRSDRFVEYHVERVRESRSFATRLVRAVQGDRTLLVATVSFQHDESGPSHQDVGPAPAHEPEDLPRFEESLSPADLGDARWLQPLFRDVGVEFRFPEEYPRIANRRGERVAPRQRVWIRTTEPLDDDPLVHAAGFAYCSDSFLLSATMAPHARHIDTPGLKLASLDHGLWLHGRIRADDWNLYEQHGYWMGAGRGISRGLLYNRAGMLLASTVQEGLVRFR